MSTKFCVLSLIGSTILAGVLHVPVAAIAEEFVANSKIDAVIVYPDAALVTRDADVDIMPGTTTLVFKSLPNGIDSSSLRITGQATGSLTIGAVDTRAVPTVVKTDGVLEARLKALRSEREGWQVSLDALEGKKAMMLRYAQIGPEKLAADAKPLAVADWSSAWETVGTGLAKIGEDLRAARSKARELDDEIKAIEAARGRGSVVSSPSRDVMVEVKADKAMAAHFVLSYRIAGAGWQPVYDARLTTRDGTSGPVLELSRRVALTQKTGEDWSDVELTVSTVRAMRGTAAPDMQPQKIDFRPMPASEPLPVPSVAMAPARQVYEDQRARQQSPAHAAQSAAVEEQASPEADGFQASFKVPGRISLPSDGSTKSFLASMQKLAPSLVVKTVPALDTTAYLETHLINTEEAPLLAGKVNLNRDGMFVGIGHIGFVASGDAFDLGFGADDRVKVARVPVRRKENEPSWFNQSKVETREFKTTIKNLHDFPVKIVLIDQMPVSENTAISVETMPAMTAPTEKMVSDKRGVMSWTYDYAPGQSRDIELAYRIKWPADREILSQAIR